MLHETQRVFRDRLVDAADRMWFDRTLDSICSERLGISRVFLDICLFLYLQPLPVFFYAKVNFLRLKQVKLLLRYAVMGVMVAGLSCTAISLR